MSFYQIEFALIRKVSAAEFSGIRWCDVQCGILNMCIGKKSVVSMVYLL